MFATVPNPIPARMKGLNRAEICDVNFQEFVTGWNGSAQPKPGSGDAISTVVRSMRRASASCSSRS
jgi:2-oxoisovalerate dehydrogenase E1 component